MINDGLSTSVTNVRRSTSRDQREVVNVRVLMDCSDKGMSPRTNVSSCLRHSLSDHFKRPSPSCQFLSCEPPPPYDWFDFKQNFTLVLPIKSWSFQCCAQVRLLFGSVDQEFHPEQISLRALKLLQCGLLQNQQDSPFIRSLRCLLECSFVYSALQKTTRLLSDAVSRNAGEYYREVCSTKR